MKCSYFCVIFCKMFFLGVQIWLVFEIEGRKNWNFLPLQPEFLFVFATLKAKKKRERVIFFFIYLF